MLGAFVENNPKVFLDSLPGLESFFKWYHLRDGQFFFFVELKGTTNVWWEIFQPLCNWHVH